MAEKFGWRFASWSGYGNGVEWAGVTRPLKFVLTFLSFAKTDRTCSFLPARPRLPMVVSKCSATTRASAVQPGAVTIALMATRRCFSEGNVIAWKSRSGKLLMMAFPRSCACHPAARPLRIEGT